MKNDELEIMNVTHIDKFGDLGISIYDHSMDPLKLKKSMWSEKEKKERKKIER